MGWGTVGPRSHISIVCRVLSQSVCADRTVMHPIAKTGFPVFCFHRGPLWNLGRTHRTMLVAFPLFPLLAACLATKFFVWPANKS